VPEKSYVFDSNQTIVLGAAPTCGIVIGGRGVSRKHCQLEGTDQGWTIIDLGSTPALQDILEKCVRELGAIS
jgi:pSer/pThr/pTyr-binding forkhead associated (FHA) protein